MMARTQARTYYVDYAHPSAQDDNPGTQTLPWRTIQWAVEDAAPATVAIFANPSEHDFALSLPSPTIDHGWDGDVSPFDYNGTPRPSGAAVDIGAFEYVDAAPTS